ncbi:uncharacterized protein C1orf159 homolog isoform X1 [Lemur catta]|uniref:uncharacterized protein C1orf159 homolog isoform X1 n=1 Tax=Lemur catta TaxID=9447 RepID=UPI001E26D002|nr:uncharacterized protein C1orf159 homolog isoform X1 [Lemur catta]
MSLRPHPLRGWVLLPQALQQTPRGLLQEKQSPSPAAWRSRCDDPPTSVLSAETTLCQARAAPGQGHGPRWPLPGGGPCQQRLTRGTRLCHLLLSRPGGLDGPGHSQTGHRPRWWPKSQGPASRPGHQAASTRPWCAGCRQPLGPRGESLGGLATFRTLAWAQLWVPGPLLRPASSAAKVWCTTKGGLTGGPTLPCTPTPRRAPGDPGWGSSSGWEGASSKLHSQLFSPTAACVPGASVLCSSQGAWLPQARTALHPRLELGWAAPVRLSLLGAVEAGGPPCDV